MEKKLISIIGLPGTGKGTQGRLLAKDMNYYYLSIGDLVKKTCLEPDSEFIRQVNKYFLQGVPQPDKVIKKILYKKINNIIINNGLILDQFPLTIGQVDILDKLYDEFSFTDYCVCVIDVPKEKLMNRLLDRKTCPSCQKTYSPNSDEYHLNVCECGTTLSVRGDDNEKAIINRFKFNEKLLDEVLSKYKANKRLIMINGDQSVNAVYKELNNKINKYFLDK